MKILYILLFILILGILVCFHEFGHYYFAKKSGILINEFAFGMGPKLLSKKKGETYWSIRAFPIGGFCAMSGEEPGVSYVNPGDKVRLVFDESNKVSKIILNTNNPDFIKYPEITVEKVDLFGEDRSPLYINDYEVNRDCLVVLSKKEEYKIAPKERNFYAKSTWQRFKVCFGGPFNNIILAIFVFLILGMIIGVPSAGRFVGESQEGNEILAGDEILSIDGNSITSWNDIGTYVYGSTSRDLVFTVNRNGSEQEINVRANYYFNNLGISSYENEDNKVLVRVESEAALAGNNRTKAYTDGGLRNGDEIIGLVYNGTEIAITSWDQLLDYSLKNIDGGSIILKYIRDGEIHESESYEIYSNHLLDTQGYPENALKQIGISPKTEFSFVGGLKNALNYFCDSASTIFSTLWLLLTSKEVGVKDMGGFLSILDQTAQYASSFTNILYWIGLLSVNLAIVNLLPIPALDGGRILFIVIEGITHKKLKPKTENIIINVFFWLLMAFIVYILIQDIIRFGGKLKTINLLRFWIK